MCVRVRARVLQVGFSDQRLSMRVPILSFGTAWLLLNESKHGRFTVSRCYLINPLALELDIEIVAHHLCKMWIFYETKKG